MALETRSPEILRFGTFEVDVSAGELRKQGKRIKLQEQPFQVLTVLLRRPGDVVTREELRAQIWPQDTFVDFDNSLNTAINKLREALGDSADNPRFIETLPRRGYRFLVPVTSDNGVEERAPSRSSRRRQKIVIALVVASVIGAASVAELYLRWKKPPLTEKDTLVLADFLNSTGDPVFDETLRQGLSAQLEQSPSLNLLSSERISQTLSLMTQAKNAHLTAELAMEVCKRTGGAATIVGSIATLGGQYVLGLKAAACGDGDSLAEIQVTANGKEQVLNALGNAATKLRDKLGESLTSLQKYDVPLQNVTTSSLDALNAYTLGLKAVREDGPAASIPFFRQAIQLDPNFAMAYVGLGVQCDNMGEVREASQYLEKAFALRERVSRREYFYISSMYFDSVAGDMGKAAEIYKLWAHTYPQDLTPLDHLGNEYLYLGQYPQALEVLSEEKRLAGAGYYNFVNLVDAYLSLNRFHDARLTLEDAVARKEPLEEIHGLRYLTAFAENNLAAMQSETDWAAARPEAEAQFLYMQSDTEAYFGHGREAWRLSLKASATARRDNDNEIAAVFTANGGLHQAELGNSARALEAAKSALNLPAGRDVRVLAALVLARAGFPNRAKALADEIASANPSNTILNFYWLPVIRAAIELDLNRPTRAIEILQRAEPYEFGVPAPLGPGTLYPSYIRGQAYLGVGQGNEAATEFQELVDHPGCVLNFVLGPLARLQLGRAYALSGDKTKARTAYQDFLALWKDADPDIPILRQAKAEYAKLQ